MWVFSSLPFMRRCFLSTRYTQKVPTVCVLHLNLVDAHDTCAETNDCCTRNNRVQKRTRTRTTANHIGPPSQLCPQASKRQQQSRECFEPLVEQQHLLSVTRARQGSPARYVGPNDIRHQKLSRTSIEKWHTWPFQAGVEYRRSCLRAWYTKASQECRCIITNELGRLYRWQQ